VNKNAGQPVGLNLGHTKYTISGSDEQIRPDELRSLEKLGLLATYDQRDEWWSVTTSGQNKLTYTDAGTSSSTPIAAPKVDCKETPV